MIGVRNAAVGMTVEFKFQTVVPAAYDKAED